MAGDDDGRDYHGELIADEVIESRISQRKTFGPPTAALGHSWPTHSAFGLTFVRS